MGAPVATAAALANTRTGRRIGIGLLLLLTLLMGMLVTPLIAIPFAVAGEHVRSDVRTGPIPAANGEWGYPQAGGYFKGRGYGVNPSNRCSYCTEMHHGYDMAQGCGSTIYAAGPGIAIITGSYMNYGNTVVIDHGHGLVSIYGHMQWGSLQVRQGQNLTAGTPLGKEGTTGRSYGCHLHFELRQDGVPFDPQPFLAARGLPLQ